MTAAPCPPLDVRITRSLLGYGVLAGPFYVVVSLAQALTREGFRLERHAWSLLENGSLGWIQVTNLALTGLMTVAAAVGVRRALPAGRVRTLAPALIAAYGTGLVLAAAFRADPARGFPVGAPERAAISWHGAAHLAAAGVGFGCLAAATWVLATRFGPGLAWFSRATGVLFLGAFAGIASGDPGPAGTLAFVAAVILVCAWLTVVSLHLYRES